MNNTKKIIAFTLAEVLITLGIIGVVAAITIPTIISNVDKQTRKSQFMREYSLLSSAAKMIFQENNGSITNVYSSQQGILDSYKSYLKYTQECPTSGPDSGQPSLCWASQWYAYSDPTALGAPYPNAEPGLILNDGTFIAISSSDYTCNACLANGYDCANNPQFYYCYVIEADVNGFKKPNKRGSDIFTFIAYKDGRLAPLGLPGERDENNCSSTADSDDWGGTGCGGWILRGINY